MEVKRTIEIHLSEKEVKEIIANHMKEEGYNVNPEDVVFSVSNHTEGYGMGEHMIHSFSGCKLISRPK